MALSTLGSATADLRQHLRVILERFEARLEPRVLTSLAQPVCPAAVFDWENQLARDRRELGRDVIAWGYNRLEGGAPDARPAHVQLEGTQYRLVRAKTRQEVGTLFGPIARWRHLYRPADRHAPEPAFAPLAHVPGLVANTTPALAQATGRYLAEDGATQRTVQQRVRDTHGANMGTGRLRELAAGLSEAMSAACPALQVRRLVELLGQADQSRGSRKPVLSVGRDGITLRQHPVGFFEVASCATLAVFDRAGRRLGRVPGAGARTRPGPHERPVDAPGPGRVAGMDRSGPAAGVRDRRRG
ncbi:hypothetical protein [Gemmata obscuriglobus]|uniref:Uncharacterized protein n=1 Tax=Gemmata obscuriglobus TaxID=114 RepID=A0A2Z3H993_9BACT|nr:hypothetical protein [Gemmata obscuriglobus]AWM37650.1 hypothetical protein C1280_12055 [Gemmata obscuriglobus]